MIRCNPGQMAIVARDTTSNYCTRRDLGLPIVVERLIFNDFGAVWTVRGRSTCAHCRAPLWYVDADLDPINGPSQEESTSTDVPVYESAHA